MNVESLTETIEKSLRYKYMQKYVERILVSEPDMKKYALFQKFTYIGSIIGEAIAHGFEKVKNPYSLEVKGVVNVFRDKILLHVPIREYKDICFTLLFEHSNTHELVFGDALKNDFHTQECMLLQIECDIQEMLWKQKWFRYCKSCNGLGGGIDAQTRDEPEFPFACECTDPPNPTVSPRCPRCGEKWENAIFVESIEGKIFQWSECVVIKDGLPCPSCGWNWGKGKDDTFPEFPGCDCYERKT